ncbi:hypothetical protein [Symmachiella dynata]|uniref:hypothetical protein n=1 Tax=Symmachiella dynata TaxID=2527995 RepID=UPI0030ED4A7B
MANRNKAPELRDRKWVTFRLWPEDRELLRTIADLSDETPDRYTALQQILPIIRDLELEDVREREREPLRLGIPKEVHNALAARSKATGQTITDILLIAVREYANQQSARHDDAG